MPVTGNLGAMPLGELLQWLGSNRKTGALRLVRGRNTLHFRLEKGRITGCASSEPPALMGQFLLARGKITEEILEEALRKQEESGDNLGLILVGMGAVPKTELERYVAAKAEETLLTLFDWKDAEFEFDPESSSCPNVTRTSIDVDELLLRGAERRDEWERLRTVFKDPRAVLAHTEHELHPETSSSPMAKRLYELIDGKRTLGEIILQSRASEFLATKFLYELYRRGIICIKDVQEVAPERGSAEAVCQTATKLASSGEHETALELLQAFLTSHPQHGGLRETIARVEASFIESVYHSVLSPSQTPVPIRPRSDADDTTPLAANELFVLDLIQEATRDVKALVRTAPMYEIDLIRALVGLKNKGFIEMRGEDKPPTVVLPEIPTADPEVPVELNAEIDESLDKIMDFGRR